jgi:hypothetical protein
MLTVKLQGFDKLQAHIAGLQKQVRFATSKALNATAKKVQARVVQEMGAAFDRPTPYTLRSFALLKPATKAELTAIVGLKDRAGAKARMPPAELLAHQFNGGGRAWKGLELWLSRAGLIGAGEYVAPGAGARLDRYGNMSRGQVQQLLSQLRAGPDPAAYASKSARSRRNVKKAGRIFWARGNARDGHLPRGAWIDMGPPIGLRPLLLVVSRPTYRKRIDLERIAREVVGREFGPAFDAALADAIRTAR